MKFDVYNRFTRSVQFTSEIECEESAPLPLKLGLAVRRAIKAGASLADADLTGASLDDADLARASLADADLTGASLDGANLAGVNLAGASLARASLADANLAGANLDGTNLDGAYLYGADLDGANLAGANLAGASLARASIYGADLADANLAGANLYGANGINDFIKCVQVDTYPITYTADVIQIGCKRHTHEAWRAFYDNEILAMDGRKALLWWRKYKDWLFSTIELCPARPTKADDAEAAE